MDRKIMKELFLSGKYSDMTVTCGGRVFRLHQNVVCPQSAFFEAALNGNFAVGLPIYPVYLGGRRILMVNLGGKIQMR